jgi:hypothetical protein
MMEMLTILPRRRRCTSVSFSGIASPFGSTEEQEPESEGEERSQAGVDQDERVQQLVLQLDAHKINADGTREQDANDAATYPSREKRSQDIERRRARTSRSQQRRSKGCSDHSGLL